MKAMVVAQQKGGVGKTGILVHLALHAVQKYGLKVAVIDLDTQGNASYTLDEYVCGLTASRLFEESPSSPWSETALSGEEVGHLVVIASDPGLADMEKKELDEAAPRFKESLAMLESQGYDLCLIDTPPSLGNSLAAALFSAQYVLSPIEPGRYSLQGIQKMYNTITNIRRHNKELQFLGMVPSKYNSRNPRHKTNLDALMEHYSQLVVPMRVGLRSSIDEALDSQMAVWDIKKTAARVAAKEMRSLADYVLNKMEISQ